MRLPNLIILGAPKCATTSLYFWLADHPEVYAPEIKETHYFADPGYPLRKPFDNWRDSGEKGYAAIVAGAGPGHKVLLESTPDHMYQTQALEVIPSLPSRPKGIFLLRKPSARIYSWYRFATQNAALFNPEVSFARFVEAALAGDDGFFEKNGRQGVGLLSAQALKQTDYPFWLEKWTNAMERERVAIYLLEELEAAPRPILEEICRWVGIDDGFFADFSFAAKNESYRVRVEWLHRLNIWTRRYLPLGPLRKRLAKYYRMLNTDTARKGPDPETQAVLARLDAHFAPAVERLRDRFGVDVSRWQSGR